LRPLPPKKKLDQILHNSNFSVTNDLTKMTLYGLKSCNMTGRDTASDEPHRKRVTGGIFRISFQNPVYDIAGTTRLFAA